MNSNQVYSAQARRDGRWWFVRVPELDTVGQARTLVEVEDVAKEIVGLYLDVEPASVSVSVTVELPEKVTALWHEATQRENEAREAASGAAKMRRDAVRALTDLGITQADAARALGLSPQRIHQLVTR